MPHFETPRGTRFQIGILILMGLFLGLGNTAFAQDKQAKQEPVKQTVPLSGASMFKDYCAACHGIDGKGNGPAVEFLKAPPPDLTTMANRYNEKSVTVKVEAVLNFGPQTKANAHGTLDMPFWGQTFRRMRPSNDAEAKMRINNLSNYINSIQQK